MASGDRRGTATSGGAAAAAPLYRYRFGSAEFDESRFELRVAGLPVDLERKPLDVLLDLLRHAGEVVSKDELFERVWAGRITVENVLANSVAKLRKALGTSNAELLITHPRVGYRLTGSVERVAVGRKLASRLELQAGGAVTGREHFVLKRQIGSTFGSEVWLAEHVKTHEKRVYKFSTDGERLSALKREATLSRLLKQELGERDDLVCVIDWNFETAPYFLESEYGGLDLGQWATTDGQLAALDAPQRLTLFLQIVDAVAAAHGVGVLHKDIKPANVLMRVARDGGWQAAITDFGSGRLMQPDRLDALGITGLGMTLTQQPGLDAASGTPMYIAPEIIAGLAPTVQSDIYALGLMLYQIVVGDLRRPMAPGWEQDVPDALLREDIAAATDGNPARRLTSVAELAERLRSQAQRRQDRAQLATVEARAAAAERALDRSRAKRPWVIGALVTLALGLGASLWFYAMAVQSERRLALQYEITRAINDFMTRDLIGAANPAVSGRGDVTVIAVAKAASPRIDQTFAGKAPEVQAALHRALQESLAALADSAGAIDEGRKAIAAFEQVRPPDADGAAEARIRLAMDLASASRYDEAAALINRIDADLSRRGRQHSELGVRLLTARSKLASEQLKLDESLAFDERAWALAQTNPDTPSELRDQLEFSMADTLRLLGRLKESEHHQRDLVTHQTVTLGPRHPSTLYSIAALANSLVYQQRGDEAITLVKPAIDGLIETLGPTHRRTLNAQGVLAAAYFNRARYDEAAAIYGEVHDSLAAKYGPATDNAITQRFNVAMSTQYAGRTADAEPIYRLALDEARQVSGNDGARAQTLRYHLADCLLELGRTDGVKALLAGLDPTVLNRSEQESDWNGRLDRQARRLASVQNGRTQALTSTRKTRSAGTGNAKPDAGLSAGRD